MKKRTLILIILGILTVLVMSACGGSDSAEVTEEEEATTAPADGDEATTEEEETETETEEAATDSEALVYFMLPNSTTIRFTRRDAPLFVEAMAELAPNAEVIVQNGEGDPALQQQLVEDAITQGADLIVYTSSDANLAAGSLNAADEAGVPVVLYEHDANGGPAEAHVLFDALAVGQAQGARAAELIEGLDQDVVKVGRVKGNQGEFGTIQYEVGQNEFLQPLIDEGRVEVVCEQFTPNWDPTLAQAFAEDCLTQNPDLDMFIGMNDGTTGGAVAALISQGYAKGEVIVTGGQDATVEAMQFIIQGWQDNTIFKDLSLMAEAAAEVSASILAGDGVPEDMINGEVNNDYMDVPAVYLPVENITIDNVSRVVEAGVWTWEEVCQGGEDSDVCQAALSGEAQTEEETATTDDEALVYFLLPNSTTIRFTRRDAPLFVEAMAEVAPNAEVIVQNGEGDPALQQQLVEDAITQGADLIVYTSSDANLAAGSLNAADEAGVPVVLYEHDANGGPAEAHVLFDALAVGQAQGARAAELIGALDQDVVKIGRVKGNQGEFGTMQYEIGQDEFLQPLIDSGQVEVVCEQFTPNWDPTLAQAFAEDCLTRNPDLDMFIGMNDGTTGGAVAALISQGYEKGEVIVTGGQDATIEALQFIIQGWQDNTIFKDLRVMAQAAADVSASILAEEGVPEEMINGQVNNDYMDVPAIYLPVENITIENIGTVVDAGVWSWEEVCQGGEDTEICQENLP